MIPISTLIRETYRQVAGNFGPFALVSGGAAALIALVNALAPYLFVFAAYQRPASAIAVQALMWLAIMLPAIAMAAVWIVAAVRWHRFILIGEPATASPRSLWRPAGTYFLRILLVYAPAGVVLLVAVKALVAVRSPYALWALSLVAALALSRVAIAFPAAAVGDRQVGLLTAIRLTQGNTMRLLVVWLAAVLPLEIVRHLAVRIMSPIPIAFVHQATGLVFTSASILMSVTAVSLCYRHFARATVPAR
jgi:hypothetical protein